MEIVFEASTLTASKDDRIIEGMLVPYGEEGRTNLGRFEVPRGALEIPEDPAQMSVNIEHKREAVFGGGARLTDTPAGLMFAARAANTPEGDKALEDVASGKRTHWSVEAANIVVDKGKALAGRVFGAALVEKPAFPSASILLAALAEDEDGTTEATTEDSDDTTDDRTETVETYTDEFTDEDGNTASRKTTVTTVKEGNTTTVTTVTETVEPEPEEDPEPTPTEEETPIVNTLTASARRGATRPRPAPAQVEERPAPQLGTLYAALSEARTTRTPDAMDTLMAALNEFKTTGPLGPAAGGDPNKGLPDNWVGQLWDGREYDRRFINLHELGTAITATGKRGYTAHRGTEAAPVARNDGSWSGNLADIKSATAYIKETTSALHRWALAETIAREFVDLPGGAEFLEAYFKLLVEDYAMWSDETALRVMIDTAGAPLALEDHLSGYPAASQYPDAMVALIQGIRTINRRRDTATYAVVNAAAMEQLIYTPKDLVPEYVTFAVNTERNGSADGGKVTVVEASSDDVDLFVDLDGNPVVDPDEPAVLVGARAAIEFDELGTTPITFDALEIARGGIDRAHHGYLQEHRVRPQSLALIGTALDGGTDGTEG